MKKRTSTGRNCGDSDDEQVPSRRIRRRADDENVGDENVPRANRKTVSKKTRAASGALGEIGKTTPSGDISNLQRALNKSDKELLQKLLKKANAKSVPSKPTRRTRAQKKLDVAVNADMDEAEDAEDGDDDVIDVNDDMHETEDADGISYKAIGGESDGEQEVILDDNEAPRRSEVEDTDRVGTGTLRGSMNARERGQPNENGRGVQDSVDTTQHEESIPPSGSDANLVEMIHSTRESRRLGENSERRGLQETNPVRGDRPLTGHDKLEVRRCQSRGLDESVLVSVMHSVKTDIMDFVKQSMLDLVNKTERQDQNLYKLKEEVSELGSTLTMTASIIFDKKFGVLPKSRLLQKKLVVLPAIFNERLITTVMSRCYMGFYEKEIAKKYQSTVSMSLTEWEELGRMLLSLFFFSRLPKETRHAKYGSGLGQMYTRVRHGVLLSVIMAMQDNAFETFISKTDAERTASVDLSRGERGGAHGQPRSKTDHETHDWLHGSKIIRPDWLEPKYICREHCDEAARKLERSAAAHEQDNGLGSKGGEDLSVDSSLCDERPRKSSNNAKQKSSKIGNVTRNEIACEAAGMVYRIITNILHRCRDTVKVQMFHDILYLFTGWGSVNSVDQTSLRMKWKSNAILDVGYIREATWTTEVKTKDRYKCNHYEFESVNAKNNTLLRKFMFEHPELCLIVEHDVKVGGRVRLLRYSIYILEIICKLVSAFSCIDSNSSATPALCIDKSMLKIASVLSIAFRSVVDRTMQDVSEHDVVLWANLKTGKTQTQKSSEHCEDDSSSSSYRFPSVEGISLDMFQPSNSRQKDILGPMCLTLKEAEFEMKDESVNPNGLSGQSSSACFDMDDLPGGGIEADDSMAVFRFDK